MQSEAVSLISSEHVRGYGVNPLHRRDDAAEIATVPISSLRPGESPRLNGQDKAHIARLAELDTPLPPILIDRRTMKVIDGMHRLIAASLKGQETVEVRFFNGSTADAFLWAVKENVAHGLPLSLTDRRVAAARIIVSHPQLSDRALAELVGLAARTVASIRRRSPNGMPQSAVRVGRDGKVRPLSGVEGRQRVVNLLAEQPEASLRELARRAGVSTATVRDVRQRLERGETPILGQVPSAPRTNMPATEQDGAAERDAGALAVREEASLAGSNPSPVAASPVGPTPDSAVQSAREVALQKLLRDPSLRHSEAGRYLLRLLQSTAVIEQEWPRVLTALPPHCLATVEMLARQYGEMWLGVAQDLDDRARILDPWADEALSYAPCLPTGPVGRVNS